MDCGGTVNSGDFVITFVPQFAAGLPGPLLSLETELHDLLLRHEQLAAAWPRGRNPIERAKIGREVEGARTRIAEVMAEIADTPARTPQGLAVQLRRVQAAIEHDDRELAAHLVARAVPSCEGMAVRAQALTSPITGL